jgi:hypothetical protein
MAKTHQILGDHKKRGKTLVPPFTHMLGGLQEVSWVKTIIPEVSWIGLVQYQHGHRRGVELITSLVRTARSLQSGSPTKILAAASSYSEISASDWARLSEKMAATGDLFEIQQSLEPLIALYPECPLAPLFATLPLTPAEDGINRIKNLVSSLFRRGDRDPMMVQATVVWLAFDAGMLKVQKGFALAQFPEIEHYPDTEISRKAGSGIRASLNMFFGQGELCPRSSTWPQYFWNRGLTLTPCEFSDE